MAIAVVCGLSSFSLAAWIHSRWLARGRVVDFFLVYDGVLAVTAAWGLAAFGFSAVFGNSVVLAVMALPIGAAIGGIATLADRMLARRIMRLRLLAPPSQAGTKPSSDGRVRLNPTARLEVTSLTTGSASPRSRRAGRPESFHIDVSALKWRLVPLILGGALEEIVYRGTLVQASLLLPTTALSSLALVATLAAFALSHIQYGWSQVWAKAPLGMLALASVLIMGTVLPAVVAHVVFNVKVWADIRSGPVHRRVDG